MDFCEVARTRRSVRSYTPDQTPDDVLNRVLDLGLVVPSGSNRQPWKFILVKDENIKAICSDKRRCKSTLLRVPADLEVPLKR